MLKRFFFPILTIFIAPNLLTAAILPGGDEIANKINARDEGEAVVRTLTMEMIDKRGKKRVRETRAFRGELGYSTDRYFLTDNPAATDGVGKADELAYVFGFDWFGISDTLLSLQLFQSTIINPPDGLTRPDTDTTLTFLARRKFLNETLEMEILWLANSNDGDGVLRPKVTYEWRDDLKSWIGADIFYGDKDGLFGQFSDNDRIVVGLEVGL